MIALLAPVTPVPPSPGREFWVASMPEVRLVATGSSRDEAFNNLLVTATGSNSSGQEPLSNIRNF